MVTDNHYRWDFIGLSTDEKPTPETSKKVTNGSTYYTSDDSKLYVWYDDQWYERTAPEGGGGGGTTYTAGEGIDITNDTISVDTEVIQEKLTAGDNITIEDGTISATGGGGDSVYSNKTTSTSATGGAVYIGNLNDNQEEQPDPTTTDSHLKYFWALPSNNSNIPSGNSINILGTRASGNGAIVIGNEASDSTGTGYTRNVVIGANAKINGSNQRVVVIGGQATGGGNGDGNIAIGYQTVATFPYSVALGYYATVTRKGEVNIGSGSVNYGFDNTKYRVIGGVHDGQDAHDAVTVGQVNSVIDAINTALSTNIPHIGAA